MAYTLVTEGMTESERLDLDERIMQWRTGAPPPVVTAPKSRAEAIAEWGTSPEAEAGIAAAIAEQGGLVTA